VRPAEARDVVTAAGRTFALRREAQAVVVRRGDESPARRLPVAAEPVAIAAVDDARAVAVVSGRERVVDVFDARSLERVARLAAGAGPTRVAAGGADRFYVVDTTGDGLLVFRLRPEPQLTRRVALLGAPYAIAVDRVRGRLWVTLTATNEVVELSAGARPRVLRTLPSVRQPDAVAVEPRSGRAYVTGRADGVVQLVGP
jgi:DNA-binding beta-propeller fold protein YncE